jgi:hypothetical protein
VQAAILAQKPGGILLSYSAIAGQTYRAVLTEVDSYREMRSEWATYRDVRDHLPSGVTMADHFTNRLALPYPDIDDPADVPADMQQLAERLDLLIPAGSGGGLVLNRVTVGDVGMAGQVRAGRALTAADFTALGLSAPRGLWNLSDLSDASGNGRALTNKGAVTFAPGINGIAATAAQFTGSAAQALYIADTGAADPFRIGTGSWGCWLRTAKRGTEQGTLSKWGATGGLSWWLGVSAANLAKVYMSSIGTDLSNFVGVSDVCG